MRKALTYSLLFIGLLVMVACDRLPNQPSENPPVISLFAADSSRIFITGTTTIRWEVLDEKSEVRIDPAPGNVPNVGSYVFSPVTFGTFSFTLTARNNFGTTQRFIQIVVQ